MERTSVTASSQAGTLWLLLHIALGCVSAFVSALCSFAGVILLIIPKGPHYYDYQQNKVRYMDDAHRIWRTAVPALICALPNAALFAHSFSVPMAIVRKKWDARALQPRFAANMLLGCGAASAAAGLALLLSVLTNKQTSISRESLDLVAFLYSLPIVFALATFVVSVAGPALSTRKPSQTLLEVALNGKDMPWAQHMTETSAAWVKATSQDFGSVLGALALGIVARAKQLGTNFASDVANRDVLMHQSFPSSSLLRTFSQCHGIMLATAGAFFAVYALHAVGVMLAPLILAIGELGNIVLGWFGNDQKVESWPITRATNAAKHMLNDSNRITTLVITGAITAYGRRYLRVKRRAARPAFLRARVNVPLLFFLEYLLFGGVSSIQWPLPKFVGWPLRTVCLAAIPVAVFVELLLVFRSDEPDKWSRDVFGLVEGEVTLDEDDLPLDAKDEEDQLYSVDEKVSGLDEKPAVSIEEPNATALLVDLPAMPAPAVLSEAHDASTGKRPQ